MITIDDQVITVGLSILGAVGALVGIVWKHAQWLGIQFSTLREGLEDKIDELKGDFSEQLKYHERHDDARFDQINRTLQNISMQNAIAAARDNYQLKNLRFDQEEASSNKPGT